MLLLWAGPSASWSAPWNHMMDCAGSPSMMIRGAPTAQRSIQQFAHALVLHHVLRVKRAVAAEPPLDLCDRWGLRRRAELLPQFPNLGRVDVRIIAQLEHVQQVRRRPVRTASKALYLHAQRSQVRHE